MTLQYIQIPAVSLRSQAQRKHGDHFGIDRQSSKTPGSVIFRGLSLVAGARNHLQANRSLEFWFELTVMG